MEESIRKTVDEKGNKSVSYSKSWETNGIRHSKTVRQVKGGYIVNIEKHGIPKDGGKDAKYINEFEEYVTTENPFDTEKKNNEEKMFSFVDSPEF
jgi:hypothetical protein